MKKVVLLLLGLLAVLRAFAQQPVNTDALVGLVSEGYTIAEMEDVLDNATYQNYKEYFRRKKYPADLANSADHLLAYEKNKVVSIYLGIHEARVVSVIFGSSPQKFYQARQLLENGQQYREIEVPEFMPNEAKDPDNVRAWQRGDYCYLANAESYFMLICRGRSGYTYPAKGRAAPAARPAAPAASPAGTLSSSQLAQLFNKELVQVQFNLVARPYRFETLGTSSTTTRSFAFFARNGELYMRMFFPPRGNCEAGLKEVKAVYNGKWGSTFIDGKRVFFLTFLCNYTCEETYDCVYAFFSEQDGAIEIEALKKMALACCKQ